MNTAEESLKRLHRIIDTESSAPEQPSRSLQPRHEPAEAFAEISLPPQRNLSLKGKRPTFFLSRGEQGGQLLKQAAQLRRLNERVMGKLGLPYSAHLRLSSINPKGVALFHADSPSWTQRGRFLQQNLLDLLHQEGARQVTQVKLKVRFSNEPPAPKVVAPKQPSTQIGNQLNNEAQQSDGPLSAALQRLSNTLLRNRSR